ncbi:MAG: hypothetical protein CMK09_06435 [Ponticaulis sp.]|nr:hypothetical protein [Ponticaulis sp.]|tara:strand:- start:13213 stop:14598 length:1386 start_codon:yes stop_codon:yes gene_type:complete
MKIFHYSPLPPLPNGIADYAARVNQSLVNSVDLGIVTANPFSEVPAGCKTYDPSQLWRWLSSDDLMLYQIGNNKDHIEVLKCAVERPGVVVLHDLKLYYLHEIASIPWAYRRALVKASNRFLGKAHIERMEESGPKYELDYLLFDMLWDVLHRSLGIVVHSSYAKEYLVRNYGNEIADRIHIIPHFGFDPSPNDTNRVRAELSLDPDVPIILTSGFATKVKRFDWLIEALSGLARRDYNFLWVHAGAERSSEYALSDAVAAHPEMRGKFFLTGYLDEEQLNNYIASAHVVVNLRFPSVGESSGTLARALSEGRCSIVTDTAAYAEYPDDVVVKIPHHNAAFMLRKALTALLDNPEARRAFGKNAEAFAATRLSMESYVAKLTEVMRDTSTRRPLRDRSLDKLIEDVPHEIILGPFNPAELNGTKLMAHIPKSFLTDHISYEMDDEKRVIARVKGVDLERRT